MKKRWIILFGIAIMIISGLGIKFYMDEEKLNKEMINVVYSDEAKEAFDKDLKGMDSKAFTEEGKVHSYEIVRESIRRNPMGGINVELIINNDSEMDIEYTMDKFNGQLRCGGASISEKLAKLLGIWK
ncbi:DUF1310 domain-containing protein [Listeria monocytogenes]|uniref:DUF1310 domain-containing protein n=1 Tax=Listeria monocytogenes TaxID=1639 RepID=UPI0008748EAC|nr:DUF1310 domain-containing protein [Listeria monocytogenes]EDH0918949.1 DUF1310 family protein [Listeria monocytogenes]EIQ6427852.1 DUF1310 domain-containing protein [Listeria monocytogenes]EIQ6467875.1 DUF1310 domain-containing protein [Listeria monocytogenes]EIQ6473663.1 DUF1310 domain-containing protein [Listeria monocytogenes]EIZ2493109.1 DUF1310 domain-containing protein [Listeria monocytogenes]